MLGERLEHPAVRALLERYPTPTAMRAAGRRRIMRIVEPRAPRMGARLVDALVAALDAQTVTVPAEETIGRVIRDLAIELTRLAGAREQLATEIEAVFARHPLAPVLLSIPGIAARTGARILTEIGDVTRFPTAGHLAAYAGLASVTKQSGRSVNGEHRSRRGNHGLKTRSGYPRSAACTTRPHATTTPANAPKAKNTTPPSCASPAAAATSSTKCSTPA